MSSENFIEFLVLDSMAFEWKNEKTKNYGVMKYGIDESFLASEYMRLI